MSPVYTGLFIYQQPMIRKPVPANILFALLILASATFFSCSKPNYAANPAYKFKSESGLPNYSDLHYWAAHPWKWDPSDSVPEPLRKNYIKDSSVDIFFLYPTSFTDKDDQRWNAGIDDSLINAKTDYASLLYQASVFNAAGRIFSPRYRQAHYRAFFTSNKAAADSAFDIAYNDIRMAFLYYLQHFNGGRPIVIAAHSQGTVHAARLLKEFFEGKPLANKLVCAYLVGMPTPEHYFTKIPACKDSLSTGCFVGWRSFEKGFTGGYPAAEQFKSIVTNPLLWTTNSDYAPAKLNKGGVLRNFNKLSPAVVDAQVHGNILWTSKPKFFGNFLLRTKNYHIADINFFYLNIRQNVAARIGMFWKQ
ncbi:MAG: hypothetical protein JWQ27_3291 [Ferruginibacter sp.]|nr:hypothetical protein [Ferruginibacter sp.]